ncbi:MAG: PhnB protein [Actinomycetia bacterium]|nr:PhnB protein [Actinomycetes bacterium]
MKYMLLIYGDAEKFAKLPAEVRDGWHGEYMEYTQKLAASGELVAGDALQGIDTATTVAVEDGKTLTTDGPFAETKETLGGFYIVDVPDLDRALVWAAQIPDARSGKIEVRPVLDLGDM